VNALLAEPADQGELAGILRYSGRSSRPTSSVDVLVDLRSPLTMVIDGSSWSSPGTTASGASFQLVELAQRVLVPVPSLA
jgi:hypothetical protein